MAYYFGRRPVLELLKGGKPVNRVLIAKDTRGNIVDRIISLASDRGIPVLNVKREQIEHLFPRLAHQGIIAEIKENHVEQYHYTIDELLLDIQKKPEPSLLLLLDGIEDPRNLGALIRTANGAGVHGVIIPKYRSAGITPVVTKTSSGATEFTPVVQVVNLIQICQILKNKGIWIVGADSNAKDLWYQIDMTCPLALVLGNEGKGIRRLLREECDFMVNLPMFGNVETLNVSVAGGILMYEALRQRIIKKNWPTHLK